MRNMLNNIAKKTINYIKKLIIQGTINLNSKIKWKN